jgi:predicted lactoylglutathione lyase
MVLSDTISVMLLTHSKWRTFTHVHPRSPTAQSRLQRPAK